jgi:hypothetical protein
MRSSVIQLYTPGARFCTRKRLVHTRPAEPTIGISETSNSDHDGPIADNGDNKTKEEEVRTLEATQSMFLDQIQAQMDIRNQEAEARRGQAPEHTGLHAAKTLLDMKDERLDHLQSLTGLLLTRSRSQVEMHNKVTAAECLAAVVLSTSSHQKKFICLYGAFEDKLVPIASEAAQLVSQISMARQDIPRKNLQVLPAPTPSNGFSGSDTRSAWTLPVLWDLCIAVNPSYEIVEYASNSTSGNGHEVVSVYHAAMSSDFSNSVSEDCAPWFKGTLRNLKVEAPFVLTMSQSIFSMRAKDQHITTSRNFKSPISHISSLRSENNVPALVAEMTEAAMDALYNSLPQLTEDKVAPPIAGVIFLVSCADNDQHWANKISPDIWLEAIGMAYPWDTRGGKGGKGKGFSKGKGYDTGKGKNSCKFWPLISERSTCQRTKALLTSIDNTLSNSIRKVTTVMVSCPNGRNRARSVVAYAARYYSGRNYVVVETHAQGPFCPGSYVPPEFAELIEREVSIYPNDPLDQIAANHARKIEQAGGATSYRSIPKNVYTR